MKEILMMMLPNCPHCRRADALLKQLQEEDRRYRDIPIRRVDESAEPEFAETLDYYYVPTFFVDGVKRMEGVPSKETVRDVLEWALK